MGASLVWIAVLPLVVAAFSMSGAGGTEWIGPVLLGGLLALGPGLLVGAARLGRAGLLGAVGGLIVVAAIPFAVFALGLAGSGWLVSAPRICFRAGSSGSAVWRSGPRSWSSVSRSAVACR